MSLPSDLEENARYPGIESWSFRTIARDYRKVAILGLLTGLIAFVGSFIVPPTYGSSTRVLIRGRDSTLLASSGESLGNQPGVIDSQLAAALTETQAGILNTRSVAIEIVDRLELDGPVDDSGFIGAVRKYGAGTYLRARAYLAHGFYKEVERRERMIGQVQGGIGAEQVGDSYVLEIAGLWEEPEIAAQIADEAANIMVEQSIERSAGESLAYRDFLADQVATARIAENSARLAVAQYQNENQILNLDEILALSSRSVQGLDDEINQGQADLDSLSARANELEARLAETEQTLASSELITTGRSTTSIDSVTSNPTYTALDTELQQIRAEAAGAAARLRALELARANSLTGATGDLSDQEAALRVLLLDLQIAEDSLEELNRSFRTATINAQRPQVEVLRLDSPAIPTYPLGPKRYLYLAIGLFVGALAGFIWSFLKVKRREAGEAMAARGAGGDDGGGGQGADADGPDSFAAQFDVDAERLGAAVPRAQPAREPVTATAGVGTAVTTRASAERARRRGEELDGDETRRIGEVGNQGLLDDDVTVERHLAGIDDLDLPDEQFDDELYVEVDEPSHANESSDSYEESDSDDTSKADSGAIDHSSDDSSPRENDLTSAKEQLRKKTKARSNGNGSNSSDLRTKHSRNRPTAGSNRLGAEAGREQS